VRTTPRHLRRWPSSGSLDSVNLSRRETSSTRGARS
jgi:hypothetical protein